MKRLTLLFLLIGFYSHGNDIAKINQLKEDGEKAFLAGNFEGAIKSYSYLIDTLLIADEEVTINLAHAYYKTGNLEQAQAEYQKLMLSTNDELKSLSYQQLGALSKDPKTLELALSYFKESIKSDPTNEDSRYNYEMVKKRLKDQSEQNQDQENQDQDQQDKEDQENKEQEEQDQQDKGEDGEQEDGEENDQEQEGEEGEENQDQESQDQQDGEEGQEGEEENQEQQESEGDDPQSEEEKQQQQSEEGDENTEEDKENKDKSKAPSKEAMKEMNISPEKAKMILEALKNSEMQYIQQNRRKPTKKKDNDKPDW